MIKFLNKYFAFNSKNGYRPIQVRNCVIGVFVLILLFNTGFQLLNCYLLKQNSLTASLDTFNIITEINKIRKYHGLEPLIENPKLDVAALLKAQDMIENEYFNHYSPDGKAPWDWISSVKYNYKYAGENLALNFYSDQEAVQAWLNSPSHKENILNPNYRDTGIAIFSGVTPTTKEKRTVVVQMFGTEKINTTPNTIKNYEILPTTTSTTVSTTTLPINTVTTTLPTTEFVNNTEKVKDVELKENKVTLLKNIAPVIKEQSENNDEKIAVGLELVKDIVSPESIKRINNTFGVSLLFLGIFGIINIRNQNNIVNNFKKKLFLKNAFVLIIGLGFLLNNITSIIYRIKIPTI